MPSPPLSRSTSWDDVVRIIKLGNAMAWERGQALVAWLTPLGWIIDAVDVAHTYCVVLPLALIYFKGPHLYGYGMWGGAAASDICVKAGEMSVRDWLELGSARADSLCDVRLRARFNAFLLGFWVTIVLGSLVLAASCFVCCCFAERLSRASCRGALPRDPAVRHCRCRRSCLAPPQAKATPCMCTPIGCAQWKLGSGRAAASRRATG
jgi:hypothetical protein